MIARLEKVSKTYKAGGGNIVALDTTTITINAGELLLIIGPSGSGKSTLLSLLGCVIYPTSGTLVVDGLNIDKLNNRQLASLRLRSIGFVFQNFNLLAPLTAAENVMVPLHLMGIKGQEAKRRTYEALVHVGMESRGRNLPEQLSGGEQQRIAIARALVSRPKMILCDEPTASLDKGSVDVVMKELKLLSTQGKSVAVVTHDPRLKAYADRIIELQSGIVQTDYLKHK